MIRATPIEIVEIMITKTEAAREKILERIQLRLWGTGDRLPGLRELASALGMTMGTTERALQILIKQGILARHPKQGTYVRADFLHAQRLPKPVVVIGSILHLLNNPEDSYTSPLLASLITHQGQPNWLFLHDQSPNDLIRTMHLLNSECIVAMSQAVENSKTLTLYALAGMQVLCLGPRVKSPLIHSVSVDNAFGVSLGMRYLARLGHRSVAFFARYMHLADNVERVRAFRQYRSRFGFDRTSEYIVLPPSGDPSLKILRADDNRAFVREALARLFALPKPPTALFYSGCDLTPHVLETLAATGVKVPDDVSLLAFDDVPTEILAHTPLTVIAQPLEEMGRQAARAVDKLVGGITSTIQIQCKPKLIVRGSCRSMRGG